MHEDSEKSKILKFRGFKARKILAGEKSSSIRLFDDKAIQQGDELTLMDSDTGSVFARASVTQTILKRLGDIQDADLIGHEKYESQERKLENFRAFYSDRVTPDTVAKIIRFQLHA